MVVVRNCNKKFQLFESLGNSLVTWKSVDCQRNGKNMANWQFQTTLRMDHTQKLSRQDSTLKLKNDKLVKKETLVGFRSSVSNSECHIQLATKNASYSSGEFKKRISRIFTSLSAATKN